MVGVAVRTQHVSTLLCQQSLHALRCPSWGARRTFGHIGALTRTCRSKANKGTSRLCSRYKVECSTLSLVLKSFAFKADCFRTQGRPIFRTAAATADTEITVEEDTMEKMEKSLESVTKNFATLRTGRANPAMLDRVKVDYYGAPTPLKTLAGISAPESTMLVVQPYDKTAMQAIEKAIMQSDIGASPNSDGNLIRINIPALTSDRRKEMTKSVAKLAEDGKVSIRNARRESMKQLDKHEKDGDLSEDEKKALADTVQELTDDYVKQIETLAKAKQDELIKI